MRLRGDGGSFFPSPLSPALLPTSPPFLPTSRSGKEKRKFADAMGIVMENASKAAANGVRSRGMRERVCLEEE